MKILTMCRGGYVRSVGCKQVLHESWGHDVLNCGFESNTPETIEMLCKWADYIVVMQPLMMEFVPEEHRDRAFIYDVGKDVYHNPFHDDLQDRVLAHALKHGLFTGTVKERTDNPEAVG